MLKKGKVESPGRREKPKFRESPKELKPYRSVEVINGQAPQADNLRAVKGYAGLRKGWNGYSALPPSKVAIRLAADFLSGLTVEDMAPSRVAPSVVGGIGITFTRGNRKAYLEIQNNGSAYLLLCEGDEEPDVQPVPADQEGFSREVVRLVRDYLNA
jgi:hypothetical protein